MSSEDTVLAGLNAPQQEAVRTIKGPLLILAGAGSGKTRVVTRRIANLLNHGVKPWEILAITFTNKAAGEMRERVEKLTGPAGVWLSTFHSFSARLLRREHAAIGYSQDFTIYDEDDCMGVLKEIVKNLNLDDERYKARKLRQVVSGFKSKALKPEEIEGISYEQRIYQQVYQQYVDTLSRNQALDFDDLLFKCVTLLRENQTVREKYANRFKYLLVDEYQDTNGCQYEMVKLLGSGHRNVCATGDPDQSIYAWRGADVKNILDFEKDFPEAKVVRLEENYRSTKRILAIASAVIKNNTERKDKELWTNNADGDKPQLVISGDGELEAYEVASRISKLLQKGREYKDIAIFYRTNSQSRAFETTLIQSAIPYRLVGGTPFYERKEIKDALAYLRLIVNPRDDVAFRRIVNVPRRGVGESTVDQLIDKAKQLNVSLLEVLDIPNWMEDEMKGKARQELWKFAQMMDRLKKMPVYPVKDVLMTLLNETGMRNSLEDEEEKERVENLEQLVNAAAIFDEENKPGQAAPDAPPPEPGAYDGEEELNAQRASIAGFLENSALMQSTDVLKGAGNQDANELVGPGADLNRVTLMTLHMAKGLEFPVVFLCGLEEGLLPMIRMSASQNFGAVGEEHDPEKDNKAIEEERRLFYVGVTRAQQVLFMMRAAYRSRYGKTEAAIPSRFLEEVPEWMVDEENKAGKIWDKPGGFGRSGGGNDWSDRGYRRDSAGSGRPAYSGSSSGGASKGNGKAPWEDDFSNDAVFADEQQTGFKKQAPARSTESSWNDRRVDRSSDMSQLNESEFSPGDRVQHDKFGDGVVEAMTGSGLSLKATVRFRTVGTKQLLLSVAKLKKR